VPTAALPTERPTTTTFPMPLNRASLVLRNLLIGEQKAHDDNIMFIRRLITPAAYRRKPKLDDEAFQRAETTKDRAQFPGSQQKQQPQRAPLQEKRVSAPPQRGPLQAQQAAAAPAPNKVSVRLPTEAAAPNWQRAPSHVQQLRNLKAKIAEVQERSASRDAKIGELQRELQTSDDSSSEGSAENHAQPHAKTERATRTVYVRRRIPRPESADGASQPAVVPQPPAQAGGVRARDVIRYHAPAANGSELGCAALSEWRQWQPHPSVRACGA